MISEYIRFTKANGYFETKRREQSKYWMYESIHEHLRQAFYQNPVVAARLESTEKRVLRNEISSFTAAQQMLDLFLKNQ
jgi:LAO/AO transport system kinase